MSAVRVLVRSLFRQIHNIGKPFCRYFLLVNFLFVMTLFPTLSVSLYFVSFSLFVFPVSLLMWYNTFKRLGQVAARSGYNSAGEFAAVSSVANGQSALILRAPKKNVGVFARGLWSGFTSRVGSVSQAASLRRKFEALLYLRSLRSYL